MAHEIPSAIASINDDIEHLTNAKAIISAYILKTTRNNSECEQALRLIGGEIAWLQHKWNEAQKYLTDDSPK